MSHQSNLPAIAAPNHHFRGVVPGSVVGQPDMHGFKFDYNPNKENLLKYKAYKGDFNTPNAFNLRGANAGQSFAPPPPPAAGATPSPTPSTNPFANVYTMINQLMQARQASGFAASPKRNFTRDQLAGIGLNLTGLPAAHAQHSQPQPQTNTPTPNPQQNPNPPPAGGNGQTTK